jgi:DNA polymerase III alpha subunit
MQTITHDLQIKLSVTIPDEHTAESFLREQAFEGLDQKVIIMHKKPAYIEQLEAELAAVCESGNAGYLLVITAFSAQQKATGNTMAPIANLQKIQLLSFALGLSLIDPLRHGLGN